jgi:hypothetical protein
MAIVATPLVDQLNPPAAMPMALGLLSRRFHPGQLVPEQDDPSNLQMEPSLWR